jgi:hypothetical protein
VENPRYLRAMKSGTASDRLFLFPSDMKSRLLMETYKKDAKNMPMA